MTSSTDAPPDDCRAGLTHAAAVADDPLLLVRGDVLPRIAWANTAAVDLLATDAAALTGSPLSSVLTSRQQEPLLHQLRARRQDAVLRSADGTRHPVRVTSHPVPGHDLWTLTAVRTAVRTAVPTAADGRRSAHHRDETARLHERRAVALTEHTPVPTLLSDVGLRLGHVNDAFARLFGLPAESLLGTGWLGLVEAADLDAVTGCAERALHGEHADVVAGFCTTAGRRLVHLRLAPAHTRGQGPGFVGTADDVTDRRALEEQLAYQARHDALTGLPNRAALFDQLQLGLDRAPGTDPHIAVLFLDLDDFKTINDSLGHDAGDSMLVEVARRLRSAVREMDVVTRMGGDEFVVVCPGVQDDAEAEVLAARVLEVCTQPLTVDGVRVHPSASIGVARAGTAHGTAQNLLRDADIAMYDAKSRGKNRFAVCDDGTRLVALDTLQLLADLHLAIDTAQVTVAYQPVVHMLRTGGGAERDGAAPGCHGSLPAVEALARWTHPTRGPVPPQEFVALAEGHQLISRLTAHVLDTACAQLARWRRELEDLAPARVNVNLSALELSDPRLLGTVTDTIARHGLPPSMLCLERTESAVMADPAASRETLLRLRAVGVSIAIDDFGVGYSSLAYLQHLPVDHLKIDRSFVAELTDGGGAVAEAVISLARALGLSVIAEGVEVPAQAQRLLELGCDLAQGWLWAPALTGEELSAWVQEHAGRAVRA